MFQLADRDGQPYRALWFEGEMSRRVLTRGFCVRKICAKSVEAMVIWSIGLFALICVVKSELCDFKIP